MRKLIVIALAALALLVTGAATPTAGAAKDPAPQYMVLLDNLGGCWQGYCCTPANQYEAVRFNFGFPYGWRVYVCINGAWVNG